MKENIRKSIDEAIGEISGRPMKATTVERVLILNDIKDHYADEPQPLKAGKMLYEFLDKVSVPLEDHDLIAGRAINRLLSESEEEIFRTFQPSAANPKNGILCGTGHTSYSWDMLIELGISGLIEKAEKNLEKFADDSDKVNFSNGFIWTYRAISNFLLRYSKKAKDMGDEALSIVLSNIADKNPETFREALQLCYTVAFIDCAYLCPNSTLTLGRLDKFLYPLYEKDINEGRLTQDEARDIITDFYCKHNLFLGRGEHQLGDETNSTTFSRIYSFDSPQYLILGGTKIDGSYDVNELTYLFAECIVPAFKNPVIVFRYANGMEKEHPVLWHTLMKKALESSSLMIYNDSVSMKTLEKIGIPKEDAIKEEFFGCNWPAIGSDSLWMSLALFSKHLCPTLLQREKDYLSGTGFYYMRAPVTYGLQELFVNIARELAEKEDAGEDISIEDFYSRFFDTMRSFIKKKLEFIKTEQIRRNEHPSLIMTYGDPFTRGATDNVESSFAGGSKYHMEIQSFTNFASFVNEFIVVDKLVFEDKQYTLRELVSAMDANYEGYEEIRAKMLAIEKFGSNGKHSNKHAGRIAKTLAEIAIEPTREYLEKYGIFLATSVQSDTWGIKWGSVFGASLDGRKKGEHFSQNVQPAPGSVKNGLTAVLSSVAKLPLDSYLTGALNLDISPKQFEGEKGTELFGKMMEAYFTAGGLHVQISSVSAEDLKEAQRNPADHMDLMVRVTGYSGIFVDMPEKLQNNIIERTKYNG